MYITSTDSGELTPDMIEWFEERANRHIKLVRKYCNIISESGEYDSIADELLERAGVHDESKFKEPEYTPYIYITWHYKCKDDGIDWESSEDIDEQMNKATEHHVKNNAHHPEFHSNKEVDLINRSDRDKPPEELIDATEMEVLDIAEMVADWCAMGEEKGNSATEWADKNVNIRWKFSSDQVDHIYNMIDIMEA